LADSPHVNTPPAGGVFRVKAEVSSPDDVRRALTRIAHEIIERNQGAADLVLVGLQRGGVWMAERLAELIGGFEAAAAPPVGSLDVSFHRDDIGLRPVVPGAVSDLPGSIDGKVVVLVDDGRDRCSWPYWSIVAIESYPSDPTSSARTCRRAPTKTCWQLPMACRFGNATDEALPLNRRNLDR
jgi:Phosphoribosyl transferase domain